MILIRPFLLAICIVFATQANTTQHEALSCNLQDQTLTIKFANDVEKPQAFGISHGNTFFYINAPAASVNLSTYQTHTHKLVLPITTQQGVVFADGNAQRQFIFTQPGLYRLLFANNLETEPDNTYSLRCSITLPRTAIAKPVDESKVEAYADAVAAGDRNAVRLVFSLYTAGASSEVQDVILGKLIPTHPVLFLQELKRSRFVSCKSCLIGLVGNLGSRYVDHFHAQLAEIKRRKNALKQVKAPQLGTLRNASIAALNQVQALIQKSLRPSK